MSYEFPEIVPRTEVQSTKRTYRTKDSRYHMRGSRCTDCEQLYYPPREGLICPNCFGKNLEPYTPSPTGEVLASWIDDVGYPAVGYTDFPPRTIVAIRLDDGIHIISEIVEQEGKLVPTGSRVRMVIRKHKREDTGNYVYGYKFVLEETKKEKQ
jgi:uncharacterized OB-fold protein